MKQVCIKALHNVPFLLMIVFCLVILTADLGEAQQKRMPRGFNPKVNIGEFPPDFELPRLTIKTDETGKPVGIVNPEDTVRLSSFRNRKPVCMIMSSYT